MTRKKIAERLKNPVLVPPGIDEETGLMEKLIMKYQSYLLCVSDKSVATNAHKILMEKKNSNRGADLEKMVYKELYEGYYALYLETNEKLMRVMRKITSEMIANGERVPMSMSIDAFVEYIETGIVPENPEPKTKINPDGSLRMPSGKLGG